MYVPLKEVFMKELDLKSTHTCVPKMKVRVKDESESRCE